MITAIKVIFIIYASWFSATTAWYVAFENDFVYKSNMTFDETVKAFKGIKVRENHLTPPSTSIDSNDILPKDTLKRALEYHINYYDTLEKSIYHVMIYQQGFNQKYTQKNTYARFHYLQYSDRQDIPYVRKGLRIRQNKIIKNRFENLVIDRVRVDLNSLNHQAVYKNRIKRVIHFMQ